jgi:ABC-2 type transport system ATP-binding protein
MTYSIKYQVLSMYAVEVENISKMFKERGRKVQALKGVDLRIREGEIFSLLGPNGAGKTTLLNIIVGMLLPDKGSVKVLGRDVSKDRNVLEQMNFVSGETRYHWNLTVTDILKFYGFSYGLDKKTVEERMGKLMRFFEIDHIPNRKFFDLSTGERMRLIFAKAMINQPKLLLFDEPTVGLDPNIAIKVRKEIKRVNREMGTTILLTSHYMDEVEQLSDRIAFINKGEIIDIGRVEKVKMKKFQKYDVFIKVREIKNKLFLKRKGFEVKGRRLHKTLSFSQNLGEVLQFLAKNGFEVTDVETKKPTLEDYFVKILGDSK